MTSPSTWSLEDTMTAVMGLEADELRRLNSFVVDRIRDAERRIARAFKVGDRVAFDSRRNGRIVGRVTKVNQKTVIVAPDEGVQEWKVSAGLLERVQEGDFVGN